MAESATFRIRRVKCRDEMGGKYRERFGNDEIKCAVFSADLRGSTRNSGRIDIYDNFDDGDEKRFNPPREVVTLDLAGATGEVELNFTILLIESQVSEGDGLKKAWDAFVELYEKALTEELSKRRLTVADARAIAVGNYLAPRSRHAIFHAVSTGSILTGGDSTVSGADTTGDTVPPRRMPGDAGPDGPRGTGHVAADADAPTAGSTAAAAAAEDDKKQGVGDAFVAAIGTACALFVVKYAGKAIGALIGWAKDKIFPPITIKAKIDTATPSGSVAANAQGVAEFRGHDGIYEMEWDLLVR